MDWSRRYRFTSSSLRLPVRRDNCRRIVACVSGVCLAFGLLSACAPAQAQLPTEHQGEVIPRDVREMYEHGLQYLANTQTEEGDWADGHAAPELPAWD